jgi:predicted outer membrane protein
MKSVFVRAGAVLAVLALAAAVASTAVAGHRHHRHHARHVFAVTTSAKTCNVGSGPSTPQGVSGLDVEWLKTSVQGDYFEIEGGHIALSKSSNRTVRALAERLISDHTKSLQDAEKLAAEYGIKLEHEPTPTQQWQLSELAHEWTGKSFDVEYTELEIADHQQDIQETQDEVSMGCDTEIVSDAKKEIPMLQMHLQLSEQAHAAAEND